MKVDILGIPSILSAVFAGIITFIGVICSNYAFSVIKNPSVEVTHCINISFGILFFIVPIFLFVIGIPYVKKTIIYRLKNFFNFKALFRNTFTDEFFLVVVRGVIWFLSCTSLLIFFKIR